jgi:predicted MFS family arabinose efflux permease
MPNNKQDDNNLKNTSTYLKFTGMAFQMIAIIGIFTYAGYKIDESAGHHVKWVTAALSLIGVFISIYVVIKSLKE